MTAASNSAGPGMLVSNVAQGGAALAVALRAKNIKTKSIAASSGFTAVLGITEPALYGVNLRFKKPLIAAMIGGGIGGLVIGIMGVGRFAQVAPGLLALPSYINPNDPTDFSTLLWAVIGTVTAFVSAFFIALALGVNEQDDAAAGAVEDLTGGPSAVATSSTVTVVKAPLVNQRITSPLAGTIVPLTEVPDPVFAQGSLGQGVAVAPTQGRVHAPADATVTVMFPTGHAVGLTTDDGAELLIHIGLDTVQLDGKHFTTKVATGDRVAAGDLLVEFDLNAIKAAGYDLTTPIVVTNTPSYATVRPIGSGAVQPGEPLLELTVPATELVGK